MTSLYDSIALPSDAPIPAGYEYRAPVQGVVYARRHVSGPVNLDDGMWRGME